MAAVNENTVDLAKLESGVNMTKYFIGVARSNVILNVATVETYWCVQSTADIGDKIILYRPRNVDYKNHGIFAEAIILDVAENSDEDLGRCSNYGLFCATIKIVNRFNPCLTAKEMKSDKLLQNSNFVRKSFQFTTIAITALQYKRIIGMTEICSVNKRSSK